MSDRQTDRHLYLIIKLRVVPSGAKSTLLSIGALSTKYTNCNTIKGNNYKNYIQGDNKSNELYNKLNYIIS